MNKITLKSLQKELEQLKSVKAIKGVTKVSSAPTKASTPKAPIETHKSSVAHDIKNSYIQNLHMKSSMFVLWLLSWVLLFILNLSIKIYKFLKYNYLFDVSVERLTNVNGKLVRTSFIFSNIYSSPYIKWGSDRSIIKLFDVVLNIIYNNPTFRNDYSNKI